MREAIRDWQFKRRLRADEVERLAVAWDRGKESGTAKPLDMARARLEARRRLKKSSGRSARVS